MQIVLDHYKEREREKVKKKKGRWGGLYMKHLN